MLARIREFIKSYLNDIILLVGVILISLLSFAAGYLTAQEQQKEPIRIEQGIGGNSPFLLCVFNNTNFKKT